MTKRTSKHETNVSLAIQGIIDPKYGEYSERICFLYSCFEHDLDGLEIGIFNYQAEMLAETLGRKPVQKCLSAFKSNTLHIGNHSKFKAKTGWQKTILDLANKLHDLGLIKAIGFHLDMIDSFGSISAVASNDLALNWENLGSDSRSGNTVKEAEIASRRFPKWGMLLDMAHATDMARFGQPSAKEYMEMFSEKINQVHFSWPDNIYPERLVGKDFETNHSLACLALETTDPLVQLIRCTDVGNVTIEGVVPPGKEGLRLVRDEARLIRKNIVRR